MSATNPLMTPDGRYIVIRGRLWRASNPGLSLAEQAALVLELSAGRRAVKLALRKRDQAQLATARSAVNSAKIALGERGPPWWTDGAKDFNRYLVKNTPYAGWYERVIGK